MKPKLEKFLKRALYELPGHIVILISINQETDKVELMSNFNDNESAHSALMQISNSLNKKPSLYQKIKQFFNYKTKKNG